MLKAKQELELATVERQVYEEEFERGGYMQTYHRRATMLISAEVHNTEFKIR